MKNHNSNDIKLHLIDEINALLPQTQCRKCGYNGCLPYAKAIICEKEEVNRCVPGGSQLVKILAKKLDRSVPPVSFDKESDQPHIVKIRENDCIGCTKCIQACPVDAIVGAAGFLHTVIAEDCTGCDLCIDPCPTDCIEMVFDNQGFDDSLSIEKREKNRFLYERRNKRLSSKEKVKKQARQEKKKGIIESITIKNNRRPNNSSFVVRALYIQYEKIKKQYTKEKEGEKKQYLASMLDDLDEKMKKFDHS